MERAHTPTNENVIIFKAIRELLVRDWIVQMKHAYKEANCAADFLVSYSLITPIDLHVLFSPPAIFGYFIMMFMGLYTLS